MTAPGDELERLLDGVWRRRRSELLDRVRLLGDHLDATAHDDGAWSELGAEAHRLTGALGSLGFDDLARDARSLELAVSAGDPRAVALRPVVERLHQRLGAATSRPTG